MYGGRVFSVHLFIFYRKGDKEPLHDPETSSENISEVEPEEKEQIHIQAEEKKKKKRRKLFRKKKNQPEEHEDEDNTEAYGNGHNNFSASNGDDTMTY